MIFSGWLKVHALIAPAHRPVHFPDQFALNPLIKRERAAILAGIAGVVDPGGRLLIAGNARRVAVAVLTIDAEGIILAAPFRDGIGSQGLVLGQDVEDLQA